MATQTRSRPGDLHAATHLWNHGHGHGRVGKQELKMGRKLNKLNKLYKLLVLAGSNALMVMLNTQYH
jgi:hypothetical protein